MSVKKTVNQKTRPVKNLEMDYLTLAHLLSSPQQFTNQPEVTIKQT